jgi:hypothetical protein
VDGDLVYCDDTCELTEELQLQYVPEQRRLFIDSFKVILKAVLLRNGKKQLSMPLAHAIRMKETYANIQGLLKKIWQEDHQWNICAELKVWQC